MTRRKFTEQWLRSIKTPKTERLEFVDALCPGLYLRVSPRGIRSFSALSRVAGRLVRVTIGRHPRWSVAEAREEARTLLRAMDAGTDPRIRPEPAMTYSDIVDAYFVRHLEPNVRSARNIRRNLQHKGLERFLPRPASAITKRELAEAVSKIAIDGSPHTATNVLRNLKMMFNWAVSVDLIASNPCGAIRPPARTTERDRVLTDAEIVAVWQAMDALDPPFRQMFKMFMLTGQRRCEVSTMRWSDIVGDVWTIPREAVKKDRPHSVPLPPLARQILSTTPSFGAEAFVFTTDGGKSSCSGFSKKKAELDRLSGVSGWTIHDLRRTVRSKMAELRVPREIARKVLNHEDGKVDRIYNRHEYLDEKREALEKWAEHLKALL